MDSQLKRYARKLVEEQLGYSKLQLAQIADDISFVKTQQDEKFGSDAVDAKPLLTRFKVRIYGVHDCDVPSAALPWAYPQTMSSGLRGECLGLPMLPRGTFVYVSKDMQSSEYYIERVCPNIKAVLPTEAENCFTQTSGYTGGDTLYPASDTTTGNSLSPGNEILGGSWSSLADYLQNTPADDAAWTFPTLDGSKNAISGITAGIEDAIKDVEKIKKGLIGNNSILRQSLETLENVEKSAEIIAKAISKQVKLITGYITTVMKQLAQKALAKFNTAMNGVRAALPLSGKFAQSEFVNKIIKIMSCLFNFQGSLLEGMVLSGLLSIINKTVNTASCLIENFISNFVGQIVGQLSALIEGAMASIGNVLGSVTDVLSSVSDFLSSIMDLLECKVTPGTGDPVVKEWNFLNGGEPIKISVNIGNIFEKAQKVGESVKSATKVPANLDDYKFKFDPQSIVDDTLEDCDTGPQPCGVPDVTFWGGKGSGAKGNPVVSTAATNFGQLMGVEVVESGNYTQAPYVTVSDKCGGGRGAVLEAILGPVEGDDDSGDDFTGDVDTGDNKIVNFDFLPLAAVTNKSDLIGMEIEQITNSPSLPVGTRIIAIEGDTLILSNNFEDNDDTSSAAGVSFRIKGYTPDSTAVGITTFDVAVKYNRVVGVDHISSAFVIDNRQQRTLTLEKGKTYKFVQSRPSNGLLLKAGTDELELIKGDEEYTYDIADQWYDEVRIHPLRFSTKPDGIHNCDIQDVITDPDEWLLAKDGLDPDDWVLTTPDQGWSEFLQNYGRYPEYKVLPGVHEGTWEVDITELGTYTFEMQADNWGTITFDGIFIGATHEIPKIQVESTVTTESISSIHQINYVGLKRDEDLLRVTDKYIEFDDDSENGFDKNASFSIVGGDATFSDDGRSISGTGPITLKYEYNDRVDISQQVLDHVEIEGVQWIQLDQTRGETTQTVVLEDKITTTDTIVYDQALDLAKGPHRVSTFLEVEIFQKGKHFILATIENIRRNDMGTDYYTEDFHKNPGALAWVLRDPSGQIVRSSNDPFVTTTETLITNCGVEYTDGVTIVGEPGKPGAYVEIAVSDNTPSTLYYYCENHGGVDGIGGMGGKINIVDGTIDENMGCRNATVVVDAVNDKGSVIALRDLRGGTGYRAGTTNLMTQGGNGNSLTLDIIRSTDEGTITAVNVSNGGLNYLPGDIVTPLCNFGKKKPKKTGTGVVKVKVKETGWGFKPWPDGSTGGMGRTWADRCQTVVHRANGDWDIPYTFGEVITLYKGDCIKLPAKKEICITEFFDAKDLPGSLVIDERVLPKSMVDFDYGREEESTYSTFEDAIPLGTFYEKDVTYVERIDSSDPDYDSGLAQWWFYYNGDYKGTFIQDSINQIPQIIEPRDGKSDLIYRISNYKEKVQTSLIINPDEWMQVASEMQRYDPDNWVLTDAHGWSPFLKNYGVFPAVALGQGPGEYDELGNIPQSGTWAIEITDEIQEEEEATYYFEVQADNQGSINFDGTFLGSTTVFKSHNDSTFFEVNKVTKGVHVIYGTIMNFSVGQKTFSKNPAALAWVLRKGPAPDRKLVTKLSTVKKEIRNIKHAIIYEGLKAPGDVRYATSTLLEFDDDSAGGFDINAKLQIIGGDATFSKDGRSINGTGDITLKYSWTDSPRISGQVLDYLTIEGVEWDQGKTYSGEVTKTVTLVDVVTTKDVQISTDTYVTIGPEGEIVATSLDPFQNTTETTDSDTKSLFGLALYESKTVDGDTTKPTFDCEKDYLWAKTLGYSDCDIRHFIESNGIDVDQCMRDKLNDPDWGKCGEFQVRITAPPCPEVETNPCPEGYHFENGTCVPTPSDCPPGHHKDDNGNCVPDDTTCPPGYKKEKGVCVPIVPTTCPPSDTYRVITCIDEIIVTAPGFGYNCCEDTVVIEPSNGAEAVIDGCDGGILSVRVTKCGAGFTELPEVYIKSKTGLNAFLTVIMKFHRENFDEFPEGTVVNQVIDCVGNVGPNAKTEVVQ